MAIVELRHACEQDVDLIMTFITDLAIYEKEPDAVTATPNHIRETLFCDNPQVFCLIAEVEGNAIGFAVYFFSYSTWLGQHGIYLEDLFITPEHRGVGAGKLLLKELAKIAVEHNCGRVEWSVLDWNEPSIKFYESLGAQAKTGWTVYRLDGEDLEKFASK